MTPRDFLIQAGMMAVSSMLFKKPAQRFTAWFNTNTLTTSQGIALGLILFMIPVLIMVFAVNAGYLLPHAKTP